MSNLGPDNRHEIRAQCSRCPTATHVAFATDRTGFACWMCRKCRAEEQRIADERSETTVRELRQALREACDIVERNTNRDIYRDEDRARIAEIRALAGEL